MTILPTWLTSKQVEVAEQVVLVPGNLFFTHTLELPAGMEAAEVASFIELTLEELSPFPLEQLGWGYVTDESLHWVLIMAICRPRVPTPSLADWDDAYHVLPSFYPLLLQAHEGASELSLVSEGVLTVAHYREGCPLPVRFTHQTLTQVPGEDEDAVEPETLDLSQLPATRDGYRLLDAVRVSTQGAVSFTLKSVQANQSPEQADETTLSTDADSLWRGDLRDPDFKVRETRARHTGALLWKGLLAAGATAAVFILLGVLLIILSVWEGARRDRILGEADAIAALELQEDNLIELKQFAGSPFEPVRILEALNQVRLERMPNSAIHYTATTLNKDNEVVVQGMAGNIGEVNRYAEELVASGRFAEARPPSYQTRGNETRFTLNMRY
ncbi:MAG: hypothetical protein AAGA45_00830, partial [Verrucomicrobiota bacterium]